MSDWKIIDGYENYEVSKFGEVRNIKTGNQHNEQARTGPHLVSLNAQAYLLLYELFSNRKATIHSIPSQPCSLC